MSPNSINLEKMKPDILSKRWPGLRKTSPSVTNGLNKQMHRFHFSFFLFQICVIWLCALNLSLSVFTVALGSSLHPQLMDRVERERASERQSSQLSLWSTLYCWLCHGAMLDGIHSIISMPRCYKRDKWILQNSLVRDPIYSPWTGG